MKRTYVACATALLVAVGGCSNAATATAPAWTAVPTSTPTPTTASPAPTLGPASSPAPTVSLSATRSPTGSPSAAPTASATPSATSSSALPSPSASAPASPAAKAASDAGTVGTMPRGFVLPGTMKADDSVQNLDPCIDVKGHTEALAQRTASRFSREAAEEHFVGNGAISFASEDDARAFMLDAIAKSESCKKVRTRTGVQLRATRLAPSNPRAWDRAVFTSSQIPTAKADQMTWGQGALIVRRGQNVAVYNAAGMYDEAPAGPSKEAVAAVTAILDALE